MNQYLPTPFSCSTKLIDATTERLPLYAKAMTWFTDDNTPTSTDTDTEERDCHGQL